MRSLKNNNKGYSIQEIESSFFGIGSSMGGDLIALESMSSDDLRVILTPFIGMSKEDSYEIGNNFSDFSLLTSKRLDHRACEWFTGLLQEIDIPANRKKENCSAYSFTALPINNAS